ncbi:MAG TPA: glycerate kinase [Chloroflexota bacterium]|nr:glycerate kinase [Chloroflexota bacterium]
MASYSRYNCGMRVICAPDSFKGSLSAGEVAAAMAAGVARAAPRAQVRQLPLADGGEGTVAALVAARGGATIKVAARDPLDRPIDAEIGLLGGAVVVAEMASASGLPLLRLDERNPFRAGTYGTGQLIRAALDQGASEIILGVGGSATMDGGAGALAALGARLLDQDGRPIPPGNAGLAELATIDLEDLDPRLRTVRLRVACDVRNPLVGPEGAAAVFGPQKGARPTDIAVLDANLARLAAVLARDLGITVANLPGAGAAGGLAAGLLAIGARSEPGIELVLETLDFDRHLEGAALVLTGEGRIDRQTAHGKVISGVLAHARRARIPVIALGGSIRGGELGSLYAAGLAAAFPITDGPMSYAKAFSRAAGLLRQTSERVTRLWLAAGQGNRASRDT